MAIDSYCSSVPKPGRVEQAQRFHQTGEGIFKVPSAIDVHPESPFVGESLLHGDFFLLFPAIGFLLFLYSLLVEPLRLFHPVVNSIIPWK